MHNIIHETRLDSEQYNYITFLLDKCNYAIAASHVEPSGRPVVVLIFLKTKKQYDNYEIGDQFFILPFRTLSVDDEKVCCFFDAYFLKEWCKATNTAIIEDNYVLKNRRRIL